MEIQIGKIKEIIFHNENNGFTVAIMETGEEYFTIVGTLASCHIGSTYELKGTFKNHSKYGEQFAFTHAEEVLPTTAAGIEGFLASGIIGGVGPKTASAIVAKFGDRALDIIDSSPEKLIEIEGIGVKKAEVIAESFKAHKEFADISIFFQEYGISTGEALKIYKRYGRDAIEIIQYNPYVVIEDVEGIGFKKADNMARKLGVKENDQYRIKSGVVYTLSHYMTEGNTFLPREELREKAAEMLGVMRDEIDEAIVSLVFDEKIHLDTIDGVSAVYLWKPFSEEQDVVRRIKALTEAFSSNLGIDIDGKIRRAETKSSVILSDSQKAAVKNSLTGGVTVITGGPGTGKTTIINTIIEVLEESALKVLVAAPTGRAAKRITETSGHIASTIHRMLGFYYSEDMHRNLFAKNEENPLDTDCIIIDEASMIDISLMSDLLKAIKPGTRLILVGDVDQLPSVGPGRVLGDIIDSEYVFTAKLTEIFRQAEESMIVVNAHRINKGEYPYVNDKEKDFFLIKKTNEKDIIEEIKSLLTNRLPKYYKVNPLTDIQVITPMKMKMLGTENLNEILQNILNPPSPGQEEKKHGKRVFRTGDKVMQIKNNYQIEWRRLSDGFEGEGVFNGEIGYINSIDNEDGQMTVVFDEEKYTTYNFSQLDELELAYAITVHKSQGSEYPIVIMPMSWFPPVLANRNLLYTAITRGKNVVILVGSEDKMKAMVNNNKISKRYTGLEYKLRKLLEAPF